MLQHVRHRSLQRLQKKKDCHRPRPEAAHSYTESLDVYHSLRTPVGNSHIFIFGNHTGVHINTNLFVSYFYTEAL